MTSPHSHMGTAPSVLRRRDLGIRGEEAAAQWYRNASYGIIDRNWRCAVGEIDLIAVDPGETVIVFCEVKTRSSLAFGSPAEAVTSAKQRRLRRLASRWLAEHPAGGRGRSVRFDVAEVTGAKPGDLVVEIVSDAF